MDTALQLAGTVGDGHQLLLATADPTVAPGIVDTVTSNSSNLLPVLLTIGGLGIAVGAGVFALKKGWKVFRGVV